MREAWPPPLQVFQLALAHVPPPTRMVSCYCSFVTAGLAAERQAPWWAASSAQLGCPHGGLALDLAGMLNSGPNPRPQLWVFEPNTCQGASFTFLVTPRAGAVTPTL